MKARVFVSRCNCSEELEWGGMPRRVDSFLAAPARTPFDGRASDNLVENLDLGQPFSVSVLLTDGEDMVATCQMDHTILGQMMGGQSNLHACGVGV
jgi:hypothetical protein